MRGILSNSTDAAYNLATEEYLLHNIRENIFFLYVNKPSIIVGKHQNTHREINYHFSDKNNIPVYRRLSGGGTVFHDDGNLNFCFILSGERGKLVDFEKHTMPIKEALENLGISVKFGKRHDLSIDGKKISGNASHVYKNRVMHHGTLLYNANLDVLNESLKTNPANYKDKAVRSVRSEVTNIADHLESPLSFQEFIKYIYQYLLEKLANNQVQDISQEESQIIKDLVDNKYSTWKWNYGYSPSFEIKKNVVLEDKTRIRSKLKIEKGQISDISLIASNSNLLEELNLICEKLINQNHQKSSIFNLLDNNSLNRLKKDELARLIF